MIELAIIIIVTICDALRDRWTFDLGPAWTKKQWRWHIVKWLAFYLPLLYIVVKMGVGRMTAVLAIVCFFLWRGIYYYKRGETWTIF